MDVVYTPSFSSAPSIAKLAHYSYTTAKFIGVVVTKWLVQTSHVHYLLVYLAHEPLENVDTPVHTAIAGFCRHTLPLFRRWKRFLSVYFVRFSDALWPFEVGTRNIGLSLRALQYKKKVLSLLLRARRILRWRLAGNSLKVQGFVIARKCDGVRKL